MATPEHSQPEHSPQVFGEVLKSWRERRGMSKKALAAAMDFDPSYISHIEIDHLHGRLYTSRMRDGVQPIPVEEYRGTGQPWRRS